MTLIEVAISLAITAVAVGCTVSGYFFATTALEQSGESLAASSLALQRMEQARSAKWDVKASPAVDELATSNFPAQVTILDLPRAGSNVVYATNFTTISLISSNPPLKMIQVDCVWRFMVSVIQPAWDDWRWD
jgi:hypothetical protein